MHVHHGQAFAHLTPGKWYFSLICNGCDRRIAVLEKTTNGARSLDVGEIMLRTRCLHCGADGYSYRSDEVQSFEYGLIKAGM